MDLRQLQEDIRTLVADINSRHKHPYPELISYMKLIEEIGEVTEIMLSEQISSRKSHKKTEEEIKDRLGDELADSLIALISLANDYSIDLTGHVDTKLTIHRARNRDS